MEVRTHSTATSECSERMLWEDAFHIGLDRAVLERELSFNKPKPHWYPSLHAYTRTRGMLSNLTVPGPVSDALFILSVSWSLPLCGTAMPIALCVGATLRHFSGCRRALAVAVDVVHSLRCTFMTCVYIFIQEPLPSLGSY